MVNWTDPVIQWQQLGSSQIKRLTDTWGKDEKFIAKYDKSNGIVPATPTTQIKVTPQVAALPGMTPLGIRPTKQTKPAAKPKVAKKVVKKPKAKKVVVSTATVREKHTGADGEVKFVSHRNLYVGFFGGRVVVTKRTVDACKEVLRKNYNIGV